VDVLTCSNKIILFTSLFCFLMQQGDRVMVAPWVKPDDYGKLFPTGVEVALVPSGKNVLPQNN
jgi:hypothetical protein